MPTGSISEVDEQFTYFGGGIGNSSKFRPFGIIGMGAVQNVSVVPISAEFSAVVCRLVQGQVIHGLRAGDHDLPIDNKFRIFAQGYVTWIVIVQRRRVSGLGVVEIKLEDGRVSSVPAIFSDAPWSEELGQIVTQLVRHMARRKRKLPHDALHRFLSLSSAWGERVTGHFAIPGHVVVTATFPDTNSGVRQASVIVFAEDEIQSLEAAATVTESGVLVVILPEGRWRGAFLQWGGQLIQLDLGRGAARGWSAFEEWLAGVSSGERGQLADLWSASGKGMSAELFQALQLPVAANLSVPGCRIRVAAIFSVGNAITVLGEAEAALPEGFSFQLHRQDGAGSTMAATTFTHPAATGGIRFALVGKWSATPGAAPRSGAVIATMRCCGHADRQWLCVSDLDSDPAWQALVSWRPESLYDDAYVSQVILPCSRGRRKQIPVSTRIVAPAGSSAAVIAPGPLHDAIIIFTGDVDALAQTVLGLFLVARGTIGIVRIGLLEPDTESRVRPLLQRWATRFGLTFVVVTPHRRLEPFTALQAVVALVESARRVLVLGAGVVPLSVGLTDPLAQAEGDCETPDLEVAPGTLQAVDADLAIFWRLSPVAHRVLSRLDLPVASLSAGLKALILALRDKRLTWKESPFMAALAAERAGHDEFHPLDNILLSEVGWTFDLACSAKFEVPLGKVRQRKTRNFRGNTPDCANEDKKTAMEMRR